MTGDNNRQSKETTTMAVSVTEADCPFGYFISHIAPFAAWCLNIGALATCDFIRIDGDVLWTQGDSLPFNEESDGSLGLTRNCISSRFDIPRDKPLDYAAIFAIIPVVLAPWVACMTELQDGETSGSMLTRNLFIAAIVVDGIYAIFSAMTLFAFTTSLCDEDACIDIDLGFTTTLCDEDACIDIENEGQYCTEQCKAGAGVALVVVACVLWIIACLESILLLRKLRNHRVGMDISNNDGIQDETKEFHA